MSNTVSQQDVDELVENADMVLHYIKELKKIKNKISVKKGVNIDFAINIIKDYFNILPSDDFVMAEDCHATVISENENGEKVIKTQRIDEHGNIKDCLLFFNN
tara:strand:+ start:1916 stop:2224 length:309 start_codon:yes stop_codon:yes gene_type:complete